MQKCKYFRHPYKKGTPGHAHMCTNLKNVTHRCGYELEDWKQCPISADMLQVRSDRDFVDTLASKMRQLSMTLPKKPNYWDFQPTPLGWFQSTDVKSVQQKRIKVSEPEPTSGIDFVEDDSYEKEAAAIYESHRRDRALWRSDH
jgi:hypothetical protein